MDLTFFDFFGGWVNIVFFWKFDFLAKKKRAYLATSRSLLNTWFLVPWYQLSVAFFDLD